VNNSNLHPILHRFHNTTDCWSTFSIVDREYTIAKCGHKDTRNYINHTMVWCKALFNTLNRLGVDNESDGQTRLLADFPVTFPRAFSVPNVTWNFSENRCNRKRAYAGSGWIPPVLHKCMLEAAECILYAGTGSVKAKFHWDQFLVTSS